MYSKRQGLSTEPVLCKLLEFFKVSNENGVGGKVDGPKGGKWTTKLKVDGPSESGRSWVTVDGLLTKSGRSFDKKWTVPG